MNKTESKRLKETWEAKEQAYLEVSKSSSVDKMIAKRIEIANKSAESLHLAGTQK